ncbi:MAG: hypothetical protein HY721_10715 [Planctomycetes bacterium]|nr:hypothetical protein [Planctomycetota bacterium]
MGFAAYDFVVRGELFRLTRSVYAESLLERGRYEEAAERIRALQRRHPFAYASLREAELLAEALEAKALESRESREAREAKALETKVREAKARAAQAPR